MWRPHLNDLLLIGQTNVQIISDTLNLITPYDWLASTNMEAVPKDLLGTNKLSRWGFALSWWCFLRTWLFLRSCSSVIEGPCMMHYHLLLDWCAGGVECISYWRPSVCKARAWCTIICCFIDVQEGSTALHGILPLDIWWAGEVVSKRQGGGWTRNYNSVAHMHLTIKPAMSLFLSVFSWFLHSAHISGIKAQEAFKHNRMKELLI